MKPSEPIIGQLAVARPLHRGRLFRKYFLLILALVCGTLVLSGAIGLYFSYQENKAALASLQREKAVAAAARIEQFVRQIEQQLEFAALPQLGIGGIEQRLIEFGKLLGLVEEVTDIAYIDASGREQLVVSRLAMNVVGSGKDRSQEPAFKEAKPSETWFGPVYFRKETEPYMAIAVRSVKGGALTQADVNLKFMGDVVTRIKVGDKGKAYVVDNTGHLVTDPDIGLVLRKTNLSALEQVKRALHGECRAMLAKSHLGGDVLTACAPIDLLGWKVFVEQPVSEVYAALNATILRTAALLVAGLLFSALAALWLARSMVRPISTLQEGAARIGAGELDQEIDVRTGDELEALADQFNQMSAQLRESYAGLERKVEERTAELKQALEQQTATSDILQVTSSSPTDIKPVFDTILHNTIRLCEGNVAVLWQYDGGKLRFASHNNATPEAVKLVTDNPLELGDWNPTPQAGLEKRTVHVLDVFAEPRYRPLVPMGTTTQRPQAGTVLAVPLLRYNELLGVITIWRYEKRLFSEKQVAMVNTFAAQAVIAIENVRLFNETKESLEQQTAIAEVLRVISSSHADVKPMLEAVAERATRLCEATATSIYVLEDKALRRTAFHGPPKLQGTETLPYTAASVIGRAIAEGKALHIDDIQQDQQNYPVSWEFARQYGHHTMLAVPLMREGRPFGAMFLRRTEVRPFNEKQIALSGTFADQAAIGIQNVRLFNEIQEKSAQLEIANKHKSDFLANMSHELRTPLNAIIGFSEVLSERMFGEVNEKQADYLKDIHESGRHLLSLINDILDLSKIEAGRMELEISSFHLPTALSNAMTLVRERAQRHGIGLGLEVDPRLDDIRADERKFKQIVVNLLSNAVKFTPDGGRVDVSAKLDTDKIEIAVRDTGIGIAPGDHAAVFEEFKQAGRDYTRKAEGTGLGLALTRRFVELHGGAIRLESASGKGSTFTITLPLVH